MRRTFTAAAIGAAMSIALPITANAGGLDRADRGMCIFDMMRHARAEAAPPAAPKKVVKVAAKKAPAKKAMAKAPAKPLK